MTLYIFFLLIIAIGAYFATKNGNNTKSNIKKNANEEENDFMAKMDAMIKMIKEEEGSDCDELPNHIGEFGYSKDNPIPLTSVSESRKYLSRLIYIKPGSSQYTWQRTGSMHSTIVKAPIDEYNLLDTDSNVVKTIYIWPYNRVNSKKVPEGFGLMDE
ncbi:MAG: hypothetical protein QM535_07995 [Limnohabitans sp.]|nr:hypothetical protein [Limnohabitans sp.]